MNVTQGVNLVNMDEVDLERMRRVLQHRLLNIVSGVKSASSFLSTLLDERMKPREREYFPLIINECDQVCFIVERLDQVFGTLPEATPHELQGAVQATLEEVRAAFPLVHVLCDVEVADKTLSICANTVRAVLMESVKNACQSSQEPIQVVVRDQDAGCVLRVIDQGGGFSGESENMAFEAFFTTKAKSLGLGLTIAKRYAEALGGRASLGTETRGSYVEFYLPYITA